MGDIPELRLPSGVVDVTAQRYSTSYTTTVGDAQRETSTYACSATARAKDVTTGSGLASVPTRDGLTSHIPRADRLALTRHMSLQLASTSNLAPEKVKQRLLQTRRWKKAPFANHATHSQTTATGIATSASKAPGASATSASSEASTARTRSPPSRTSTPSKAGTAILRASPSSACRI